MSHLEVKLLMMNNGTWRMDLNRIKPSRSSLARAKPCTRSGFQKTFHKGQLPAAMVLANGSAVFCRIEEKQAPNKTVINYTVEKARLSLQQGTQNPAPRV